MYKKPDHYADKAKKMGYPARSVFKLEEIDTKYRLCKPGCRILDIGAAPGSWSLYCLRKIGKKGSIIAVDLKEIGNSELRRAANVQLLQGDITDAALQEEIIAYSPFDVLLSDAAPNTTGNKTVDCGRSVTLGIKIITTFLPLLKDGGNIAVKVFQGGGATEILNLMRPHFRTVKGIKPKASRNNSVETFYIATGKLTSPSPA